MKKWSQLVLTAILIINVLIIVAGSMHIQSMEKKGMLKPIVKTKKFKAIPCIKPHLNIDKDTLDSIFKEGKWEATAAIASTPFVDVTTSNPACPRL